MALDTPTFWELAQIARAAKRELSILSLGYPDLLIGADALEAVGIDESQLTAAPDADAIARWHSFPGTIYDTTQVLRHLGLTPTYIDIRPSRGVEFVADLNSPLELPQNYDIVLDAGTLEHCFNIGQAFVNVLKSMKIGGHAIHVNPCTMLNHGFWNLSPTAYADFYEQNGCEVLKLKAIIGAGQAKQLADLPKAGRFQLPPEAATLVIARKIEDAGPVWPTQRKYLQTPALKVNPTR